MGLDLGPMGRGGTDRCCSESGGASSLSRVSLVEGVSRVSFIGGRSSVSFSAVLEVGSFGRPSALFQENYANREKCVVLGKVV